MKRPYTVSKISRDRSTFSVRFRRASGDGTRMRCLISTGGAHFVNIRPKLVAAIELTLALRYEVQQGSEDPFPMAWGVWEHDNFAGEWGARRLRRLAERASNKDRDQLWSHDPQVTVTIGRILGLRDDALEPALKQLGSL